MRYQLKFVLNLIVHDECLDICMNNPQRTQFVNLSIFILYLFIKHVCCLPLYLFYTLYHTAMKIITSSGSKLLPKPSTGSTAPIVVVTSAGSSAGGTLVSASNTLTASGLSSSQSPSALHRNTVITNPTGMLSLHYHILEFLQNDVL